MSYSKNPHLPLVRMQAVSLVRGGWSARKTARYLGFHHTAVLKWLKKADEKSEVIPTESSRPHSHPRKLKLKIVNAIVKIRKKHRRCAEVVHRELFNTGIVVSLSSVKRTLHGSTFCVKEVHTKDGTIPFHGLMQTWLVIWCRSIRFTLFHSWGHGYTYIPSSTLPHAGPMPRQLRESIHIRVFLSSVKLKNQHPLYSK